MARVDADCDLLFGIAALQNQFITRRALCDALRIWASNGEPPLDRILLDCGALTETHHALVTALIREQRAVFGIGPGSGRTEDHAADAPRPSNDLLATLPELSRRGSTRSPAEDPYATRAALLDLSSLPMARFRPIRVHAKGGLGEVFVALDSELNREVALKQIQGKYADDPNSRARFLLEAEVTGGLEHPGVVPVYSLGRHPDGRPYYAMRFIRGDTLRDAIAQFHEDEPARRNPSARALRLRALLRRFIDVCNAIGYAHSRGIVHRDIKPGNILLGNYGETLVVDWGLAKPVGRPEVAAAVEERLLTPASASGTVETVAGTAVGTPQFMSPEQAAGRFDLLGPASDIYSLGATLYCLLTGRPPLDDPELGTLLRKVQQGNFPPPRALDPTIEPALEAICLKAMTRAPQDRYATAQALIDDLEHWMADEPVSSHRENWGHRLARWTRRHRALVQIGSAALIAVTFVSFAASLVVNDARRRERAAHLAADAQRLQAERLSAWLALDRGLALCELGYDGQGLTRIAHALTLTPPDAPDLARVIRLNLDAWGLQCQALREILPHSRPIHAATFSPDGRTIMTGGGDDRGGEVRLWDANTGQSLGPIVGYPSAVLCGAYRPGGKSVAIGTRDGTAQLFDAESGQALGPPMVHPGPVATLAFRPDGGALLTGGDGGPARLWDVTSGRNFGISFPHEGGLTAAAFRPDGKAVLTAGKDGTIRTWDPGTGTALGPPLRHPSAVLSVAYSPDGQTILAGTRDGIAQLWDAETGQTLGPPLVHHSAIYAVAFDPQGTTLLTGSEDDTTKLWDARTGLPLGLPLPHRGSVMAVAFSPDGKTLLTGGTDMMARLWKAGPGQPVPPSWTLASPCRVVAYCPDGKIIATVGQDGTARLREMGRETAPETVLRHPSPVLSLAIDRDGRRILTGGEDGTTRLWDAAAGTVLGPPLPTHAPVVGVAFTNGRSAMTASRDGQVRLWDLGSGTPFGLLLELRRVISLAAFSPDGRTFATAEGGTARLWDLGTGRTIGPPLEHQGPIYTLVFDPKGATLLTGGEDNTALLWDARSGRSMGSSLSHRGSVVAAAFSADGQFVLTASRDKTARLWDVASSKAVGPYLLHSSIVSAVAFAPDGHTFLTAADRSLRFGRVPDPLNDDVERIVLRTQVITGMWLDTDGKTSGLVHLLDAREWKERRRRLNAPGDRPIP